ncbi:hypothetical protein KA005_33095 [bacterium]|nr:hypothetical protein [bacterium]
MKHNKKIYILITGGIFIVLGIIFALLDQSSITGLIKIDIQKKIFTGSFPVFLFLVGAIFLWIGFKESKNDILENVKVSLDQSIEKVKEAADFIEGKRANLLFRIGPDNVATKIKRLLKNDKLVSKYSLSKSGKPLKINEDLTIYIDTNTKALMAEIKDVPMDPSISIQLEFKSGSEIYLASQSTRVRIVNMETPEEA